MMGKIEEVRHSKSGKTLSAKVGGQWYTTKNWELENMVGQGIIFEPSTSDFQGNVMHWINDYVLEDAAKTPAAQAFEQAHAAAPYSGPPTPPVSAYEPPPSNVVAGATAPALVDRDASIVAQALTKASAEPGEAPDLTWGRYTKFYHLYMARNHDWTVPF